MERAVVIDAMPGEVWEAQGKCVFRGRDCIGIFDTDNATDAIMEERARVAASAPDMLSLCISILNGGVNYKTFEDARAIVSKIKGTDMPGSGLK